MVSHPDDAIQGLVESIGNQFLLGYRRQKARALELLSAVESDQAREALRRLDPDAGHRFEQRTTEEREQRAAELALGTGVAHAIIYAIRELNLR